MADEKPTNGGNIVIEIPCGKMVATAGNLGTVVESPPGPDGRTVDARPPSGGRSFSTADASGTLTADLSGPLLRGKENELVVLNRLIEALNARGDNATLLPMTEARDQHGEDGLLILNGNRTTVQVVTMPSGQQVWHDLTKKEFSQVRDSCVDLIRSSLVHKRNRVTGSILALDGTQVGSIASDTVVRRYIDTYGDPEREFNALEVWIIGPTKGTTIRLK